MRPPSHATRVQTTYAPDTGLLDRYSMGSCTHCVQLLEGHHSDRRCYTTEELLTRLHFFRRSGRWPGADEGCTEEGKELTHV